MHREMFSQPSENENSGNVLVEKKSVKVCSNRIGKINSHSLVCVPVREKGIVDKSMLELQKADSR